MRGSHLVKRFVGSLWPLGPSAATETWVASLLLPGERDLWLRMPAADRRHAAAVAHRAEAALGPELATRPALAAALLHDVGKVAAGLGTYGRVVATVAGGATRRRHVYAWSSTGGFTRRVGLYLRHPELGADMLALAQSDPLTVSWAREHHLPETDWTVPPAVGAALKAADDD
ncbi:MAG TPA: hypothetical protein VGI06_09015 [Acidimicrobiales bacterium]|jgi:hypothetical protein